MVSTPAIAKGKTQRKDASRTKSRGFIHWCIVVAYLTECLKCQSRCWSSTVKCFPGEITILNQNTALIKTEHGSGQPKHNIKKDDSVTTTQDAVMTLDVCGLMSVITLDRHCGCVNETNFCFCITCISVFLFQWFCLIYSSYSFFVLWIYLLVSCVTFGQLCVFWRQWQGKLSLPPQVSATGLIFENNNVFGNMFTFKLLYFLFMYSTLFQLRLLKALYK